VKAGPEGLIEGRVLPGNNEEIEDSKAEQMKIRSWEKRWQGKMN